MLSADLCINGSVTCYASNASHRNRPRVKFVLVSSIVAEDVFARISRSSEPWTARLSSNGH